MARRGGMYKSEKRRKELKRKKKQEGKLLKRQKKTDEPLDEEATGSVEAVDAVDIQGETPGDGPEVESTDEEAVPAGD